MKLSRIRSEAGQSLVEFAVILPLVVMVVLALADFGRALYMYLEAEQAASDAARLAAVNYGAGTSIQPNLKAYLQQQLIYGELQNGSGNPSTGAQGAGQVCLNLLTGASGTSGKRGDPVNVQVKSTFKWIPGGVLPSPSLNIVGSSTMRLEQDATFSTGCS